MELYINDILVDLDQRIPFPLTYSISDIKDLTARRGNNSKTITLPGTKVNYNLMLNIFSLTASENETGGESGFFNYDPTVKVPARYYNEGVLEFQGVCQLQECVWEDGLWNFNIILISDTIDYMSRLSKIKVNELGWSEYDHPLTKAVQEDSWNGIVQLNGSPSSNYTSPDWDGTGYYYGLIDYGFDRPLPDAFSVEHFAPQVFWYEILQKAFTYCGISWSSTFLESQRFKRMLMAWPGGDYPQITAAQADDASTYTTEINNDSPGFIINSTVTNFPGYTGNNGEPIGWQGFTSSDNYDCEIVQDTLSQAQNISPLYWVASSEGVFDITYSGTHNIELNFSCPQDGTMTFKIWGRIYLYLDIIKNGSVISNDLVYQYEAAALGYATSFSLSMVFDYSRTLDLNVNDTLEFRVRAVTSKVDAFLQNATYIPVGNTFSYLMNLTIESDYPKTTLDIVKQQQQLSAGDNVNVTSFLPDMDCATFFKGVVTAFNLYVKPSTDDLTVLEIEPLNEFYNASADAINWTDKVDRSKSITVVPTINYASKNYNFNFVQDDDYFNERYLTDTSEQYGSFSISSQNPFSTGDSDFNLPFAQKLLVKIPYDDVTFTDLICPRSFQVKFKEDGTSEIVQKKGKPFGVQLGGLRLGSWYHIDEAGTSNAETYYPYVGHLDDVDSPSFDFNWGVPEFVFYGTDAYTTENLYMYHEKFIKEMLSRYGKEVKLSVNLDSSDINSLDFRDLILIDSVVYRLQKVQDYDSGKNESTKVELIRIIEGEGIAARSVRPPLDPLGNPTVKMMEDGTIKVTEADIVKIKQ